MSACLLLVLMTLLHNATAQKDPEPTIGEQLDSLIRGMGDYLIWLFGFGAEEAGDTQATQEFTDHIRSEIDAMLQQVKLIDNEILKAEEERERLKQREIENQQREVFIEKDIPEVPDVGEVPPFGEQDKVPYMPVIPIE